MCSDVLGHEHERPLVHSISASSCCCGCVGASASCTEMSPFPSTRVAMVGVAEFVGVVHEWSSSNLHWWVFCRSCCARSRSCIHDFGVARISVVHEWSSSNIHWWALCRCWQRLLPTADGGLPCLVWPSLSAPVCAGFVVFGAVRWSPEARACLLVSCRLLQGSCPREVRASLLGADCSVVPPWD